MRCGRGVDFWCGECYARAKGRSDGCRVVRPRRLPRRQCERYGAAVRRPDPEANPPAEVYSREDCELFRLFPTLCEFLTDTKWDDGKKRKPGTLMLVCDEGRVKAWVHDVDGRKAAWVTGETLWGLLLACDVSLREDRLLWRKDKGT